MDKAPPPTRSRIQELDDQLIVHFRPRRSWGTLAFLAFWLTFWTAGGIAAFTQLLHGDLGARLFILLWLCFWAFGEATVAVIIAWQLLGHELLLVSPERLLMSKPVEMVVFATVAVHPLVAPTTVEVLPDDSVVLVFAARAAKSAA